MLIWAAFSQRHHRRAIELVIPAGFSGVSVWLSYQPDYVLQSGMESALIYLLCALLAFAFILIVSHLFRPDAVQ